MQKTKAAGSSDNLIKQGKSNGFVTQDDILALFPKPEDKITDLDHLYDQLIRAGVDVFETTSADIEQKGAARAHDPRQCRSRKRDRSAGASLR